MAQEANRPIYCIAHTGLIPTPIIPILYISYLGFIVIVTSHCQSHVPHALVSFHLTRLYMQRTSVQNWWCHHDTSHFGLANFNPIHVNSDISMCAMSTARSAIFATLESHSWLVILCHVTCTSTPLQQSAASAIVTMSLVSIILSEPTLTWADLTQIQHLLNRTFDYNWPLTFLALITNFDFDQLSKVHFSFFNYAYPKSFFAYILILGLFFHMALTSLKFDHISFWVHLYTKFANSLTYSFHIGSDPRSIQCSHSWTLSCIIQCIFEGSSQVYIPNSRHRQTSTLSLRECWRY